MEPGGWAGVLLGAQRPYWTAVERKNRSGWCGTKEREGGDGGPALVSVTLGEESLHS